MSSGPALVARRPFELWSLVRDAATIVGCLARCRGLGFSHRLEGSSVLEWVVGDDKGVFHLLLHMVGAVLSRCDDRRVAGGGLMFSVCSCNGIAGDDQDRIPAVPKRAKISTGGNQVFVKFQIGLTRSEEGDPGSLHASCPAPSGGHAPDSVGAEMRLSTTVCQRIEQMMNGNMWWASESEGLAETMTLLLRFQLQPPLNNPHVPGSGGTYRIGASPRTLLPQHHHFNDLRILLADGDATSMEVTRKLLERLGCEVMPAQSATDCLSLLGGTAGAEPPFQLVVLDIDARGAGTAASMDGFEVALRIRELSNACWLLVLVAVAAGGVDDRVRDMCRRAGVNGLIGTPVTLPALGAQLQRVLHNN
ncbi:unnamed protein product [Urochloa humidicola]